MKIFDSTYATVTDLKSQSLLGLCYGSLAAVSSRELIRIAGAHGFKSLMLLPDTDPPSAGEMRRWLNESGIQRVVLDGVMGMLPRCRFAAEHGITAEHHFRAAELYSVNCFNVPHYQGDPTTPVAEFAHALRPFCERAARSAITVSLEFLPGTGIPTLERALEIVEVTDVPNLGITLDTWHMARTGVSVNDLRSLPPGIIKDFQLSDRAADQHSKPDSEAFGRLLPGEGAQPLIEIIRAVRKNAPELPVSAEIFSEELQAVPPAEAAQRIARALRSVIEHVHG